jgi:hypothetical protein
MNANEKVVAIVNDLLNVRENLQSLSDDIFLDLLIHINRNDNEELQQSVDAIKEYNKLFDAFNRNALSLSAFIQQYIGIGNIEAAKPVVEESSEENKKMFVLLNKKTPHFLNENYIYTKPYGFTLKGYAYTNIYTWKGLFNQLCACLDKIDHHKMLQTTTADAFISSVRHGKNLRYFSNDEMELRESSKITDSVYAEVNKSANNFIKVIKILLDFYNIPHAEMKIYLRDI